jgi:hypothetical protein
LKLGYKDLGYKDLGYKDLGFRICDLTRMQKLRNGVWRSQSQIINHKSEIINPKLKGLPGGAINRSSNDSFVGKRKEVRFLKNLPA